VLSVVGDAGVAEGLRACCRLKLATTMEQAFKKRQETVVAWLVWLAHGRTGPPPPSPSAAMPDWQFKFLMDVRRAESDEKRALLVRMRSELKGNKIPRMQ
jgi:hypothetical protein